MDFRVLGPPEVWLGGQQVRLVRGKPQVLLVALALDAGRPVSAGRLVDALWGDDPPASAGNLVQTHMSALRRSLRVDGAGDPVVTQPPGYILRASSVDARVFEQRVLEGRRAAAAARPAEAAESLRSALGLWRGPALGGLGHAHLLAAAARLEETRLTVLEERIDLDLGLGLSADLASELTALVSEHPLRERLRGQLMLALHRTGRQADALAVFRAGRDALADELGIEPGRELRALHDSILRDDPSAAGQPRPAPTAAAVPKPVLPGRAQPHAHIEEPGAAVSGQAVTPCQLPPAIIDLTGRAPELARIQDILSGAQQGTTPICSLFGKAGTGKSALALHAAHGVRHEFPGGQLFASLHDTDRRPVDPAEILGWFLRALGADARLLPSSLVERAALYRSMLTGRRVLVVLDDAASEQQIRPLLPGSGGCAVLVTSRACQAGIEGAEQLGLDVLAEDAAVALLSRIAGPDRVATAPDAAREIAQLCGYLPLAVRAAGARLTSRQQLPLAVFAARLRDERRRLDELSSGDLEVRASVALSYYGLADAERAAFRRLGALGTPDFAAWVLAPLLEVSVLTAERLAERLADAQLLDFAGVDATGQVRYRFHDLLRLYARERAASEDPEAARADALGRLTEWWLALVHRAASIAPTGIATLGVRPSRSADPVPQALMAELLDGTEVWLEGERAALVVAVERASEAGLHEVACELAAALRSASYAVHNRFEDWLRTHEAALSAARAAGSARGEAAMLAGLAHLRYERDDFAASAACYRDAHAIYQRLGDARGEATALSGLGNALRDHGHFAEALTALERAQAAFRSLGNRRGEGLVLRAIGLVHRATGDLAAAADLCVQATEIFQQTGDALLAAYGVQALAKVRIRQGRGGEAAEPLAGCLATCVDLHDGFGAALTRRTLGELHLAAGELEEAERYLTEALEAFAELGLPLFRARTLRDLAVLHRRRAAPDRATAALDEALSVFEAFGSREYTELTSADAAWSGPEAPIARL